MQARLKELHIEPASESELDPTLRARLASLHEEGQEMWNRFDREVRQHEWHPFVPADYASVMRTLLSVRAPGLRFLEWGSAMGIITIMADLLGFEAYGIEIDPDLVASARIMATRFNSSARFATGSYLPAGYEWRSPKGDRRLGTIGVGISAYAELGHPLDDFDLVFGYPWDGEEPIMLDLMQRYGGADARFLLQRSGGTTVLGRRVL